MNEIPSKNESRGRNATSPFAIPLVGWKDILLRTKQEIADDRLTFTAAAVAFYSLLGIVPLLVATISLYGVFADPADIRQHAVHLNGVIPPDALELITGEAVALATQDASAGLTAFLSIAVALWGSSKAFEACMVALNIAYGEKESRGIVRRKLVALGLALGAIGLSFVVIGLLLVLPAVFSIAGYDSALETFMIVARWPVLFCLALIGFAVLMRFAPDRKAPRFQWLTVGSVVAGTLWVVASAGFTFYTSNIGDYSKAYGSLGAIILLIMWFYVSAVVLLMGAELNAEIEHQTARDSTVGAKKPMGERGAHVADTLGKTH